MAIVYIKANNDMIFDLEQAKQMSCNLEQYELSRLTESVCQLQLANCPKEQYTFIIMYN